MKILLTGGGDREKALRALCPERGHELPAHGPWDAVILPLPRSEIDEETADQLPRGQTVVCGKTDGAFDRLAQRRGWRLLRVLEDETYALANAALTAEGAVYTAMGERDRSLSGSRCLVAGYGRIGQELTARLRALGAYVTVAARRRESRERAGINSVPIEALPRAAGQADFIFNTVPSPIFTDDALRAIPEGTPLIELASPPYGADPMAVREAGVRYRLESGLPGRYCPKSAALILLKYAEREVHHE